MCGVVYGFELVFGWDDYVVGALDWFVEECCDVVCV